MLSFGGKFVIRPKVGFCLPPAIDRLRSTWTRGATSFSPLEAQTAVNRLKMVLPQSRKKSDTLSSAIAQGIRFIKTQGWVVKESDKNLGLVLLNSDTYDRLLWSQVSEGIFSEVLQFPLSSILGNLSLILRSSRVSPREQRRIMEQDSQHTKRAPFYMMPKIHKSLVEARPIAAQHSYVLGCHSKELATIPNRVVTSIPHND